ncbi:MAG: tetratricopeptide repeat protein [Ruminococcaceae bacterium]|nr:tetratricopeptide repeat protein [Oscillospiraceae bacterium]
MDKKNHDIFISFSFKDQALVEVVAEKLLEKYNITYWMCTEKLRGGDHFKGEIVEAINKAKVVLMIQSKNSISSREVPKEIAVSLEKHKTVIPFVIDDAELNGDLEYDLIGIHHVDARKPTLDERIEELAMQIYALLDKSSDELGDAWSERMKATKLVSSAPVLPKKIFVGRDSILKNLADGFKSGERVQFLFGIGGIGKTQIAKQYAVRHKADYDTVIFATYNGSIKNMIIREAPFTLEPELVRFVTADGETESDDAFFVRKLEKIKKASDERTLIVIDNFDTDSDDELESLIEGKYHLLITTRCDYSKFFPTVKVEPIDSIEDVKEIFLKNYDGYEVEADDPELDNLIELVNRHTYTVELLAQHMENSGQTPKEMIDALKSNGVLSMNETVLSPDMKKHTAYENLLKMFEVFSLSEEEKNVLRYLSFMPLSGVNAREFKGWAGLDSFQLIKQLENKSWIIKNQEGICLHPIIREVVSHQLPADEENCGDFLKAFTETIDDKKMWVATGAQRNKYAVIVNEILEKFPEITKATEEFYYYGQNLLCYSVDFNKALELSERLYDYHKKTYGEEAFKTARAAFKCGWVYSFNSLTVPYAKRSIEWMLIADKLFKNIKMETSDEISRHTMTKTSLSKMNLLLFNKAGDELCLRLAEDYARDAFLHATESFEKGDFHYVKTAGASTHLAEALYAGGRYDEAYEAIERAIDILIDTYKDENNSDMPFSYYVKARILYEMGKTDEAIALGEKTAKLYERFFGGGYPKLYETYILIGDCCLSKGDTFLAVSSYEKAIKIAEDIFPPTAAEITEITEKISKLNNRSL